MDLFARSADLFVHVAFWTVVHSLWQATALALSLAIWRRLGSERDHAARSAAAALTLLFLAVAPLATATSLTLNYRPPMIPESALTPFDEAELAALAGAFVDLEEEPAAASLTSSFSFTVDDLLAFLPKAIVLLWTLGVAWGAVRLAQSAVRLHRIGGRSTGASEDLLSRCRALASRCGLTRTPRLLYSASARGPYAFGLFRPCIVLPAAWALETPPDVLEAAIAHELAHLKRRDLWILALQRFVETTLFFHPAVWYVSRTLDAERERDADRLAAGLLGDPARYAESLCRLASMVESPGSPALTVPFHGETRMKLLERVRHVLRTEEAGSGAMTSVGWLCLAPALLAAIFFGQTAFVGSLHADDEPEQAATQETASEAVEQKQAAIDGLVAQSLRAMSEPTNDYEALRRIFLDISGTLPTPEQTAAFAADETPGKYDRLVRELIALSAEQADDGPEGREEEEEEEGDDEDEDEDEEGDDDDENEEGKGEDAERREALVRAVRLQLDKEREALQQSLRSEAEKIEAQYRERMTQLQQEMAKAQAELHALAQKRAAELEARYVEAARAQAAAAAQRGEGERRERLDGREGMPGEDADDLTPRERRMLGIIRSLEARLRTLEGRASGADRREGDDARPGQRREEGERREGERREEGDRPREREEGDRAEGDRAPQEREVAERREREAAARQEREMAERREREAAERAGQQEPRSEEEHGEQARNHFAERLYNALRGEDILDERKPEFVRRAVLDVLEFELNEEQVKIVLERAKGEFEGFRTLVARLAAAGKGEGR